MEIRIREGYKQDEKRGSVFGECHHSDATSSLGKQPQQAALLPDTNCKFRGFPKATSILIIYWREQELTQLLYLL